MGDEREGVAGDGGMRGEESGEKGRSGKRALERVVVEDGGMVVEITAVEGEESGEKVEMKSLKSDPEPWKTSGGEEGEMEVGRNVGVTAFEESGSSLWVRWRNMCYKAKSNRQAKRKNNNKNKTHKQTNALNKHSTSIAKGKRRNNVRKRFGGYGCTVG